jgi:hypothetical protein
MPLGKLLAVSVAVLIGVRAKCRLIRGRRTSMSQPPILLALARDLLGEVVQRTYEVFKRVCLEVQQEPVSPMWAWHRNPLQK